VTLQWRFDDVMIAILFRIYDTGISLLAGVKIGGAGSGFWP